MKERRNVFRWLLAVVAVFMITMAGTAMADETINLGVLPSGQMILKDGTETNGPIYFIFSVPAAGVLNVNGYANNVKAKNDPYGIKVILCNAYGTPIDYSDYEYPNAMKGSDDIIYGVNAGTYMIRIEPFSKNEYHLGLKFTQKKNYAKYSKGKALNMKKGKKYTIVLPVGSNKPVWLKLNAPGKKKVKLTIKAFGQGRHSIRFSGNKLSGSDSISNNQTNAWKLYSKTGLREIALRKGTYYVKITRNLYKGFSNGWLQVSWRLLG